MSRQSIIQRIQKRFFLEKEQTIFEEEVKCEVDATTPEPFIKRNAEGMIVRPVQTAGRRYY